MISYKPLFKLLIDRDLKKTDLKILINMHPTTLAKLSKNEYVSLKIIDELCLYFKVPIEEILEVLEEN